MPNATPGSVSAFLDAPEPPHLAGARPWHRFVSSLRRDPAGLAALAFLGILVVVALLAPRLAPYDPNLQLDPLRLANQPPSRAHWFGTDPFGRDVLSRVLYGTRVSLSVATLAVGLASLLGLTWGALAGYAGGLLEAVLMRLVDAALSVPRVVLLLGSVAVWGPQSLTGLAALLGLTGWFGVSRLVRSEVAAVKERDFVTAARALGCTPFRIVRRHIVPHVLAPLTVASALGMGHVMVLEAGLSFLGVGVAPPLASWGGIVRDGAADLTTAWWLALFPGAALLATVIAANILADRLRAALDPRQLPAAP